MVQIKMTGICDDIVKVGKLHRLLAHKIVHYIDSTSNGNWGKREMICIWHQQC